MSEIKASSHVVIRLEFPINATKERVWKALIEETSLWWDKDFASLKDSPGVILEPKLGGKLYEETEDGRCLTWASVIAINPGVSIDLLGCMTPEWAGPTMTMLKLAIEGEEGKTVLKLTEGLLGSVNDETVQSMNEGWTFLFDKKFRGYLEAGA